MKRYRALRYLGADPISAAFAAFFNWFLDVPDNLIIAGMVQIEFDPNKFGSNFKEY